MSHDPLDRFLDRIEPAVPPDAAERVLHGLGSAGFERALRDGELARAARFALVPSALAALVGLGALVVSLHAPRLHDHLHAAPASKTPATDVARSLALAARDQRVLADPFYVTGK